MADENPLTDPIQCENVLRVDDAWILPPEASRRGNDYAVLDSGGRVVRAADTMRWEPLNDPSGRALPDEGEYLPGEHLFGGILFNHFGHVFVESTSRLHAYPALRDRIDSLLFVGFTRAQRPLGWHRKIFLTLGVDHQIRLLSAPLRVERLWVPEQLGGLGALAAGMPPLHRFFADTTARIAARTIEKVFISRAGYNMTRGGIVAEHLLEANMARQGYTLFSPERHSLAEQIAVYRGAKNIVGLDSSAFHIVGASCNRDAQVAILLRRRNCADEIAAQITGFTGREPMIVDAITGMWRREGARMRPWDFFAELDFGKVGADLAEGGFIDPDAGWRIPGLRIRTRFHDRYKEATGAPLEPVEIMI